MQSAGDAADLYAQRVMSAIAGSRAGADSRTANVGKAEHQSQDAALRRRQAVPRQGADRSQRCRA